MLDNRRMLKGASDNSELYESGPQPLKVFG